MSDNGFMKPMLAKTNEELLKIVEVERSRYCAQALMDAESVLRERGVYFVSLNKKAGEEQVYTYRTQANNNYAPGSVGIMMVIITLVFTGGGIRINGLEAESAVAWSILLIVAKRIVVIIWTNNLCERYGLNKTLWILLGVVFGGWQLIAINVAMESKKIKVKTARKRKTNEEGVFIE